MSEMRTISAVAHDIVNAGILNYLASKIAEADKQEEDRRRLGLRPIPTRLNRAIKRMRKEAEARGLGNQQST